MAKVGGQTRSAEDVLKDATGFDKKSKLLDEQIKGSRHKKAWDEVFKPYYTLKSAQLFDAFTEASATNPTALQEIKMQYNALEGLRNEIFNHIETGKMASVQLDNEEKTDG